MAFEEACSSVKPDRREFTVAEVARRHAAACLAAAAAGGLLFWPTLCGLVRDWWLDPDLSHGFVVPVVSAGLVFTRRAHLANLLVRRTEIGWVLLVTSLVVFFAGYLSWTNTLERLAVWGAWAGGLGIAFGLGFLRSQSFPLAFLLLAIPPPFFLLQPLRLQLQDLAARLSSDSLAVLGFTSFAQGNVVVVGSFRLEVVDACSGIRSLLAILTTAVLLAYILRTGVWKGAVLCLTAVPVTILANVVRIVVVGAALEGWGIDWSSGAVHEGLGLLVYCGAVALLFVSAKFYGWLFRWAPAGGPG